MRDRDRETETETELEERKRLRDRQRDYQINQIEFNSVDLLFVAASFMPICALLLIFHEISRTLEIQ